MAIPRGPVLLVRAYLMVTAATLLAGAAMSLVMRWELWSPEIATSQELYFQLFTMHGAIMTFGALLPGVLVVLPVLLAVDILPPSRWPAPWLPWVAFGASVLASSGMVVVLATVAGDSGVTAAVACALTTAASLVLVSAYLAALLPRAGAQIRWAARLALAGSTLGLGFLALALIHGLTEGGMGAPGRPIGVGVNVACTVAVVSVLPYLVDRVAGEWRGGPLACFVAAGLAVMPEIVGPRLLVSLAGLAGMWTVAGMVLRSVVAGRDRSSGPLLVIALAIVPGLVLAGFSRAILDSMRGGVHLHDTPFATGRFHALAGMCVMVVLVAAYACADTLGWGRYSRRLARIAALMLGPGFAVFIVSTLVVGSRGMARRYVSYLDEFQALNRIASIAAVVAVTGGVLAIASFVASGRPDRESVHGSSAASQSTSDGAGSAS
jgi:heme/copper-type cytochrome/quinol oxidase subunit 1